MKRSDTMRNSLQALMTALALVLAPVTSVAAASSPDAASAPATDDQFAPVEIPPPPAPEPPPMPPPEPPPGPPPAPPPAPPPSPVPPAPPPDPIPDPIPEPIEPPAEGPRVDHEPPAKIHTQRKAGLGVMLGGGAVATVGLGITAAFTILGDQKQGSDEPMLAEVEKANSTATVGGLILASGVAIVAIGGVVFANANRKAEKHRIESMARVRVTPAFGGLVVSGRF
jgi:hypothetical protein